MASLSPNPSPNPNPKPKPKPKPKPNPNPNPNAPGGERIHNVGAAVVTQGAAWPETQAKSVKSEEPTAKHQAKHVPSMPQRKPSLDMRLQESSVKSEAAPAAAPESTPSSYRPRAVSID